MTLEKAAALVSVSKEKRREAEDGFQARQQQVQADVDFEKKRLAKIRALELKKQDELRAQRAADEKRRELEIIEQTNKDMAAVRAKEEETMGATSVKSKQQAEFHGIELNRWHQESLEVDAYDDRKKVEREAEAMSRQEQMHAKAEAAAKAERAAAKRAKAEMAAETKRQAELQAKKAAERDKEGKAARDANIHYAKTHADRLHWEPPPSPVHMAQYAKDLREKAGHMS